MRALSQYGYKKGYCSNKDYNQITLVCPTPMEMHNIFYIHTLPLTPKLFNIKSILDLSKKSNEIKNGNLDIVHVLLS